MKASIRFWFLVNLLVTLSISILDLRAAEPEKSAIPAKDSKEPHPVTDGKDAGPSGKNSNGLYQPVIAPASREAENAIPRIKIPAGMKLSLWAAEPQLANPVAFAFDHRGRMFVCETFRQKSNRGVEDNRGHSEWLNDDLAATKIEDRLAYIKKHRPDQGKSYTVEHDRIRLLEDRDGDHVADHDTVFADGFHDILDGTGAGVLAHKGDIFYTCIPNLWRLRDKNNDGISDEREKHSTGYGVKFAFRGHDMHGLVIGPDGRLYWSIGDRGLNVTTKEGRHLYNPDSGAVLRCELDGSNLELFCTGLRNPQELAFDDYGNLFTVDNNSDSGDRARLYHLVQGGDYGWRMHYQYLPDRGPWNREKLWGLAKENLSQSVIPPIAHITDGPSGLVAYPGTGLGDEYKGAFFVCDFRGGPANSGVRMFKMEPDGATFKLTKYEPFVERLLATDCDFGPDGAFYMCDWVDGWDGLGKGRIYRLSNENLKTDPRVAEVQKLLAEGFDQREVKDLCKLLGHDDRRVRTGAQFALVEKKAIPELLDVAKTSKVQLARLHAIWGVGMSIRLNEYSKLFDIYSELTKDEKILFDKGTKSLLPVLQGLVQLSTDSDAEIAGQAVNTLAQTSLGKRELKADQISKLLQSGNERLMMLVASTNHFVNDRALYESLLTKHCEQSAILRWLLYRGFSATTAQARPLAVKWNDLPLETRRAAAAYGMTWGSAPLVDADPRVVLNAAQRIYDATPEQPLRNHNPSDITPSPDLTPLLVALAGRINLPYSDTADQYDALFRRVLNANFILGKSENAEALAVYASRSDAPEKLRIEALDMLLNWAKPKPADRVTGQWRPIPERSAEPAALAIKNHIGPIFAGPDKVRQKAADAAGKLGITDIAPQLLALLRDEQRPVTARVAALQALGEVAKPELPKLIEEFRGHKDAALRVVSTRLAVRQQPDKATELLNPLIDKGQLIEKQNALELLAELKTSAADERLTELLKTVKEAPQETRLDLLQAARERAKSSRNAKSREELTTLLKQYDTEKFDDEKLKPWRDCLTGGNTERGAAVFFEKLAVSCVRCHKIDDRGGDVGPNLSAIGKDKTRQYLLEAIVDPNRAVAQGFETVVLEMTDGRTFSGIIKKETPDEITLIDANAKVTTVKVADIDSRQKGISSMPTDILKELSPFEVRDLVEYLSNKK